MAPIICISRRASIALCEILAIAYRSLRRGHLAAFKGNRDFQRTQQSIDASNSDDGSHSGMEYSDSDFPMDIDSDGDNDARTSGRPARERKTNQNPAFVHSGEMQVASSSPHAASSHSASSTGHIDGAEQKLRATVEDDTLRLVSCAIRHVLYFGAPQDCNDMSDVVEFRDLKLRATNIVQSIGKPIKATDDGGLCLRVRDEDNFILTNDRVAILEAKRFHALEDGKPTISDRSLAQMTCEALLARISDSKSGDDVIVIHATQHYICFLQFNITEEYLRDFGSPSPSPCITVVATPWYDLSSVSNRRQVVLNLCALMRWGGANK